MKKFLLFILVVWAVSVQAQRFDPLHPPNTYRNADNPSYWKNDPPYEGYWQQDIHYRIKARLDEVQDVATGLVVLTYWNNSPDTLHFVFFHLYQNAHNAGSYMDQLDNGAAYSAAADSINLYGTEVLSMSVDGQEAQRELENTILKVRLPKPLPPNEKATFTYAFRTHWSLDVNRRMKLFDNWGFKHYDGTHWYPRISVYDRKFGWDTQQHLGSEFYGDFGTYDVELDMPNDQIVEATGWLQNPEQTLPQDLRQRLAISNFKDKPWGERPSVITPYDSTIRKVWRYHAENVHDFAFTADPTYRIGEAVWNGVRCVAIVQEPHASGWQNAADYCAKTIKAHSEQFGRYLYPKMVVADARDGMEYPMLTLDGGRDPDYRSLFVHEVGHNWFFGMVGNNETYRAFLDEGFTQFLNAWGLEHIDGDTLVADTPRTAYERKYTKPELVREAEVYYGYMRDAVRDEVPAIDTHSDEFAHSEGRGGGYGHVYYKTATMLYNLQYVLGDELFIAAMRHYFDQWKIRHPYEEDFRNSIIQFTHVDLNWFFDQWIDTDKLIDYAVRGVKNRNAESGQVIHFERVGSMQMPIDFTVTARDGRTYDYHIPNTWFSKKTTATVLPRWIGFDELQRDHYATVNVPTGIAQVRIDTTYRLADRYQLNNGDKLPMETTFDHHLYNRPDRRIYEGFARPDLWWNGYDGTKVGVHFHGDYLHYKHKVWATLWLNTGLGQHLPDGGVDTQYDAVSYNLRYSTGTDKVIRGSSINLFVRHLDGLDMYGGGFEWKNANERTTISGTARYMMRRDTSDLWYLLAPDEWDLNALNANLDLMAARTYGSDIGNGSVSLRLRSPLVGSTNSGKNVRATWLNNRRVLGMLLRTRAFAQYGTGTDARETSLFLAGAAPEEMMENKYVRSIGFVPYDWAGYGADVNHFQQGGGLGLRGYAGYVAPELTADSTLIHTYRGNTGAAFSAELDLDELVRFRPGKLARYVHLDVYLFGDVGSMGYRSTNDQGRTELELAPPRGDAGVGAAFTVKKFGPLVDIKPFTIRFDMPLFLSNVPYGETDHFAFRYVVGFGRTF